MQLVNNRLIYGLAVIAALVCVYFNALNGPFLLDDITSVLPARVNSLSISEFWRVTFGDISGPLGRPISVFTFALNNYFGGESAYSFKVVNLVIHSLNFGLVYWFTTLLFRQFKTAQNSFSDLDIGILSLCCAAVWALHPMQLSTVMYVVQRMAMLSATFSLGALIVYLKYRKKEFSVAKRVVWMGSITGLVVLSCLAKENGVLTILYIGLLELLYIPNSRTWLYKIVLKNKVVTFVAIVCAVSASLYIVSSKMVGYTLRDYGLIERAITQPEVLVFYIKNIFLPNIDALSIFHDGYSVKSELDFVVIASVIFLLFLCVLMRFSVRRLPLVSFGIGLFLLSHVLESTILPLELIFEHRNYLAILGMLIAFFSGCWHFLRNVNNKPYLLALIAFISIAFYAPQTYFRSIEWSSNEALIAAAMNNKPDSIRAKMEVTTILSVEGRYNDLLVHLNASAKQHPDVASFSVQSVTFAGALDDVDPFLVETAVNRISTTSLKPADVSALKDLYIFRASEKIQAPSFEAIEKLFSAATNNENKKLRAAAESVLFGMYSDLLLSLEKHDEAKAAIIQSASLMPGEFETTSRLIKMLLIENNHAEVIEQIDIMKSSVHGKAAATKARILEFEGRVLAEIEG